MGSLSRIVAIAAFFFCLFIPARAEDVLLVTDIHFNPFAPCYGQSGTSAALVALAKNPRPSTWQLPPAPPATYKQETTTGTLSIALPAIRRVAAEHGITKVLVTGDMIEHAFAEDYPRYIGLPALRAAFASNLVLTMLHRLRASVGPHAELFYVLGNNDTDRGDYIFPSAAFRHNLARGLFPTDARLRQEFATVGYSARPLTSNVDLIGLNGGLLTLSHPRPSLARKQLTLLKRDLARCRATGRHAILLMHEPFGIDPWTSFKQKTAVTFFDESLQRPYLDTLAAYSDVVSTILCGHIHMEYFVSLHGKIPLVGTLALNSLFGNNPGFKVLDIDDHTGRIRDFTTYAKDLAQPRSTYAPLYTLRHTYGPRPLLHIINTFPSATTAPTVSSYRRYYNGLSPDREWIAAPAGWPYYFTTIHHIDTASFSSVMEKKYPHDPFHPPRQITD